MAEKITSILLVINGVPHSMSFKPKDFKTGSKGFFMWGKADRGNGEKYQVSGNVVLIGSKPKTD